MKESLRFSSLLGDVQVPNAGVSDVTKPYGCSQPKEQIRNVLLLQLHAELFPHPRVRLWCCALDAQQLYGS